MLRRTLRRSTDVRHTSVPALMQHPVEMAYYFPRFHPSTHINTAGIPELTDAVELMTRHGRPVRPAAAATAAAAATGTTARAQPVTRWTTTLSATASPTTADSVAAALKDNSKSLLLLERGVDILNSVGGARSPAVANLIRPLYAARFELLCGSEHLPRCDYAARIHVHKATLHQAAPLLLHNDVWDKSDVAQLDTTCVILAHFVKAFCALHPRPFHAAAAAAASTSSPAGPSSAAAAAAAGGGGGVSSTGSAKPSPLASLKSKGGAAAAAPPRPASSPATWAMEVEDGSGGTARLTLQMVHERIEEALRLAAAAYEKHGTAHPELRWLRPKLLVLKALLTIPLTGHLLHAQQLITDAAHYVDALTRRRNPLMDGLKERTREPELGLYMLLQAEMAARIFNWDIGLGQVDGDVVDLFTDAAGFYADAPNTALDGDAIMSDAKLPEQRFEAEAYACCLRSYATFLLGAPRPRATSTRDSPVFLEKQTFSPNPLLTVSTPSSDIFSDVRNVTELSLETCRRRTGEALDRALKLNRMLYPDYRQNAPATATLTAMACMYADTRDYLYATGLFESANKAATHLYGDASPERVFLQKLRYEFLAGVGSEQEAKTASHEVVHLLKRVDALPY
ncbi:hypothetical protein NESM_000870300 [Novymonas esmeraldas]|uniref:Uncharacterized protein n=1 Tax=Novymonas esmeraldas TaxID=1808958 RepID=A0AAW0EZJ6_9TRYP